MTCVEIEKALRALGVRDDTLNDAQRRSLDEGGYAIFEDVLAPGDLRAVRERLDALVEEEGEQAGREMQQEPGTQRVADLVNKGEIFDLLWTHPLLLASAHHVVKDDFRISSVTSRASLPGHGHQGFHPDWKEPVEPGIAHICNSIWLLDDFTEQNGATRIVPGSHRSRRLPRDEMEDPTAAHPGERALVAPAGSLVAFNAHLWHAGSHNKSDRPRRAIFPVYIRRSLHVQMDQRAFVLPETYARLSPAARYVLDVEGAL